MAVLTSFRTFQSFKIRWIDNLNFPTKLFPKTCITLYFEVEIETISEDMLYAA